MEKLEVWEIEVGDFAFLCWQNHEGIDLFVIKSIISSESGNVISCEDPIDLTDVVTFVEGPEGITYEYSIKFDSFKFRRRDPKFLDNLTSDNVELSDELMDLIGKTYSSPRGEITMTIP